MTAGLWPKPNPEPRRERETERETYAAGGAHDTETKVPHVKGNLSDIKRPQGDGDQEPPGAGCHCEG